GAYSSIHSQIEGRPVRAREDRPLVESRLASPGFSGAMQIPLLRGRDFEERDWADAPGVMLKNKSMARRYWPDAQARTPQAPDEYEQDPIGERVSFQSQEGGPLTIARIVGDVADF